MFWWISSTIVTFMQALLESITSYGKLSRNVPAICLQEQGALCSLMQTLSAGEVSCVEHWADVRVRKLAEASSFSNQPPSQLVETESGEVTHGKSESLLTGRPFRNGISLRMQNSAGRFTNLFTFSKRMACQYQESNLSRFLSSCGHEILLREKPVNVLQQRFIYITWESLNLAVMEKNLLQMMVSTLFPRVRPLTGLDSLSPCRHLFG